MGTSSLICDESNTTVLNSRYGVSYCLQVPSPVSVISNGALLDIRGKCQVHSIPNLTCLSRYNQGNRQLPIYRIEFMEAARVGEEATNCLTLRIEPLFLPHL